MRRESGRRWRVVVEVGRAHHRQDLAGLGVADQHGAVVDAISGRASGSPWATATLAEFCASMSNVLVTETPPASITSRP